MTSTSFTHAGQAGGSRRGLRVLLLIASMLVLAAIAGPSTASAMTSAEKEEALESAEINAAGDLCLDVGFPFGRVCVPIPDIPPTVASPSSISGTPREGNTLTGHDANFDSLGWNVPFPLSIVLGSRIGLNDQVVDRYFTRDGSRVANGSTKTLTFTDVGRSIRYVSVGEAYAHIGPVRATFGRTTSQSGAVVPVALPLSNISAPTIAGTPREGTTLSCSPGSWSPAPHSRHLQWVRGGSVVGSGASYMPNESDVGGQLTCRESVSRLGQSSSASSNPVSISAKPLLNTARPQISGRPKVGRRLACVPGSWSPTPTSRSYQFLRGGVVVGNGRRYVVKRADLGRRLSCRESVSRLGESGSATSSRVLIRR